MKVSEMKARSRGVSGDMSPEAISRRFDILVELDELARVLRGSKRLGKRRDIRKTYKNQKEKP